MVCILIYMLAIQQKSVAVNIIRRGLEALGYG